MSPLFLYILLFCSSLTHQVHHHAGSLSTTPKKGRFEVCLGLLKSEIFTISPIRVSNNWSAIILALSFTCDLESVINGVKYIEFSTF